MRRLLFLILALLILPSRWAGAQSAVTEDLTVVSDSVTFQVPGTATGIVISVTGTWSATIDLTYSMRGTYRALTCLDLTTLGYVTSISANADLFCVNHGYGSVKATATAYTSGTASVLIRARSGPPSAQTSIGSVNLNGITLNAGRIPVLADINNTSAVDGSNRAEVVGGVARDADASAVNPVIMGGCASTATPTAMSADGDSVCAWFNRNGALYTVSAESADSRKRYISAGGGADDEVEIKATSGTLVGVSAWNAHASANAFLKCTNATAANTTPGSTAVFYSMIIPFGSGFVDDNIFVAFDTALTCYLSTGKADSDATDVGSGDVGYNLRYR